MRHIPNLICVLRLALAPWCAWLVVQHRYSMAFLVFAIAGWSDFFDGLLARKMNWQSALGGYLDPAADKLLIAVTYVALGVAGSIPWWLVFLIFGRDVMILTGVALLYRHLRRKKFPPTVAGKASTFLQLSAVAFVMWVEAGWVPEPMRTVAIGAAAAGTIYSGLDYIWRGWRMYREGGFDRSY